MKGSIKSLPVSFLFLLMIILASCSDDPGSVNGASLKGSDARNLLAGPPGNTFGEKRWKLKEGKSFYSMMCFYTDGTFRDQTNYKSMYTLEGATIAISDYKTEIFTIETITEQRLTLTADDNTKLVYEVTDEKPTPLNSVSSGVTKKWLTGASDGTVWKGINKEFTYSFLNDGRFYDSNTGYKEEKWNWTADKTIHIGSGDYKVLRLTTLFMDIEMFGDTVELAYAGEADSKGRVAAQ